MISFNSYNQLYNMQYPKVWNMAFGVHLRYLVYLTRVGDAFAPI